EHPIIQGPFGGGLSSAALLTAVSQAGGLGSYGVHHLKPDAIGELAAELHAATIRPFALNLWVSTHDTPTSPTTTRSRVPDSSAHNPSVSPIR
ncbi:MAG: nitronate monooxygenase, partial [Solirubrobacteraceae bacterium]|nr:nitronate monooxygenase [Solirubrobacteraceae bacterium]